MLPGVKSHGWAPCEVSFFTSPFLSLSIGCIQVFQEGGGVSRVLSPPCGLRSSCPPGIQGGLRTVALWSSVHSHDQHGIPASLLKMFSHHPR